MRPPIHVMLILALFATGRAAAADYVQDTGSTLDFSGTFQGDPFQGRFPQFSTTMSFDPAHPEAARLAVTITMASATTHRDDYDGEMRGGWFLNVVEHPKAQFVANGFRSLGDQRYVADGTLSLRGITRPVTFHFNWKPGARPVLTGNATIDRLEFGVGAKGDWADSIPRSIKVTTRVVFRPK